MPLKQTKIFKLVWRSLSRGWAPPGHPRAVEAARLSWALHPLPAQGSRTRVTTLASLPRSEQWQEVAGVGVGVGGVFGGAGSEE